MLAYSSVALHSPRLGQGLDLTFSVLYPGSTQGLTVTAQQSELSQQATTMSHIRSFGGAMLTDKVKVPVR